MTAPEKTLSVVCPVYNEEALIEHFHAELSAAIAPLEERYRIGILYSVDRCTDRTVEILRGIADRDRRVRVLVMSSRFGHQMSLVAGIDHSDTDAIVMLDSDLQHPPQLIPRMVEEFEKGYDIVYTIRQESPAVGFVRRKASNLFYALINLISPVSIQENAADFRLISRKVARVFRTQIRERNQFLRGLFGWVGFRRTGLSFQVQPRAGGKSKYSLARLLRFASEGVVSSSKKPLQAAIALGLVFASFGFLLAVITFIQYFTIDQMPSGWTTLVIIISGFSGIHLIFLGIIGEYIGAIFDEVKARPHYIVDEDIGFEAEGGDERHPAGD
jgi:polyisoprenyl-phosphate glycosyltransferase